MPPFRTSLDGRVVRVTYSPTEIAYPCIMERVWPAYPDRAGSWAYVRRGGKPIVFWISASLDVVGADNPQHAPINPTNVFEMTFYEDEDGLIGEWKERVGDLPS